MIRTVLFDVLSLSLSFFKAICLPIKICLCQVLQGISQLFHKCTSNQLTIINYENSCSPRQCCTYPDSINHHEIRLEAARIKLQRRLLTSDFEISCVVASSTPQMYSRRAQTCPAVVGTKNSSKVVVVFSL